MLIKSITLENFKGIQEATRIELKPIIIGFELDIGNEFTVQGTRV